MVMALALVQTPVVLPEVQESVVGVVGAPSY